MRVTRKEFLGLGCAALMGSAIATASSGGSYAPSTATGKSRRWGMVIDTRACAAQPACNACGLACHDVHNVPKIPDPRIEIKWIWKEPPEEVLPARSANEAPAAAGGLPVLCNHCASPPCVRVCPTQATWKRDDGIVMMDYHRCIGCRYCMVACPYGARSFNFEDPRPHIEEINPDYPTRTAGVVEKCDFCAERLARNEQPACVEACPVNAILFGDLNDEASPVRKALRERVAMQRKPELGTGPAVFYLV